MDLSKYISKREGKIQIVLGKISDISNEYLVLSYKYSEKKSASGKMYDVLDISSTTKFFDDTDLNILSAGDITEIFKNSILTNDLLGSVVRYEYDKYLWVAIWLNTYAQLNIPSPIFYNVENIMNDLRMMYFGKQSENEILQSIRNNWYSGKYQNDLKVPLVDISKKYTDDFSILEVPKNTELFRNIIRAKKEEKRELNDDESIGDKYCIIKKYDHRDVVEDLDVQPENLFLKITGMGVNFDWGNIYNTAWYFQLVYAVETEDDGLTINRGLIYPLSLLTRNNRQNYENYFTQVKLTRDVNSGYFFKAGDYIKSDTQFTLNRKYEIGTIVEYKAKFVVIGGYYDELDNPNEFKYLTINVNAFTKTELTNKAVNKFFKKFTENELDALNKKGKVSIKAPKKSSYNPQAGFSGDVVLVNPFQKQTMMKLGTDLDLLRDKNVLLYDAFVNVINVLNKKIESKLPKAEKKETQELFGYSPMLYGFIKKQSDFESQLNSFKEGSTLDSFAFERLQESNQKEIKYFTNLDDLINYHAQIIDMIAIIICKSYRRGSLPSMKSTSLMAKLDNLPLFIQNLTVYFDYVEYQGTHMMRIYFMRSAYSNYLCSCFFPINDFLIEKFEEKTRIDFFANIIRMFLSTSYIQRLRFGKIFQFKDNDSWKKSLEMLKPYFYLDIEMLKTLNCFKIIYEINSVPDWELTRYPEWQVNPKFGNWYNETEEIRNEFNREISFNIYTRVESDNQIEAWKKYVGQYDQTTIDVFEGKLIPKTETETDDFLQELDSMDFGDESLFASEVVNELENLDFEDPDLFN